ncbi:MAG: hypothetical protein RJA70_2175 [Pseudomonadota bacterium]|jgi:hypothetical protein
MNRLAHSLLISASLLAVTCAVGCGGFTKEEAAEAMEEIKFSSQSEALTTNSVEISTNFTLGGAVEKATAELKDFVKSQLPCAEVTLERNDVTQSDTTLVIEYGKNPGTCTYRGHTFSGTHTISIARNEADDVLVDHVWDELSNGEVSLTGSASVEWSRSDKTRHVTHTATWTRLSDGRTGEGSGDRLQRALDGGIAEGFSVTGSRSWKGKSGQWDLDIDEVEMRWRDPVPQAGKYTLDTPFDKQLSVSFNRQSETAIQVTIEGPRRSFDFTVKSAPSGKVEQALTFDSDEAAAEGTE